MDTSVKSFSPVSDTPTPKGPDAPPNERSGDLSNPAQEPVENGQQAVLDALGLTDSPHELAQEDQGNLEAVESYIQAILQSKGVSPTQEAFTNTLGELKDQMGLDPQAEPEVVLERLGGVIKAWQELSFITDSGEKRKLFLKLSMLDSTKEMNKVVMQTMEQHKVWQ